MNCQERIKTALAYKTHKYLTIFLFLFLITSCKELANESKLVKPTSEQVEWADLEIGVIIHLDINTFEPEYQWRGNWDYNPDPKIFNPKELDTDQWIRAARSAGAKYAVLVAKHCTGFSLWPTNAHEYSIRNSPWENGRGDIVRDFINSCKKFAVKPGLYYSSSANGYFRVDNPGKVVTGDSIAQIQYNKIVAQQLTELWTNYGDLFEIWFDGGTLPPEEGGPDIITLLNKYQPDAVVFQGPINTKSLIRWAGNERGVAAYPNWSTASATSKSGGIIEIPDLGGDPDGKIWCPAEADFPIRTHGFGGGWFWKEGEDENLISLDALIERYYTSVGRNANMLIGMVIDDRGLVPNADLELYERFGGIILKRFSNPLAEKNGTGVGFEILFDSLTVVNHAIIMEDITRGERIRAYQIKGFVNGEWKTLAKGKSVGHKRIERFIPITVTKIRLEITESISEPVIKIFSVYNIAGNGRK